MVPVQSSTRLRRGVGDKEQPNMEAGGSGVMHGGNNVVSEDVPETDDEAMEVELIDAATDQDVVETVPEEAGLAEGAGEGQVHGNQTNQGKTVYYKCRAALPKSFTQSSMEEVYQALCLAKHAAALAKQDILECVADYALGYLRLAFKKIHSDDLSMEICHVEESRVMKMVEMLQTDHSKFPKTLESTVKPGEGIRVEKKTFKKIPVPQRVPPLEQLLDRVIDHPPNRLLQTTRASARNDHLPYIRYKEARDEDDSEDDGDDNEGEEFADDVGSEDEGDISSWKQLYTRSSSRDTRISYLAAFYKFLQSINGGWLDENEALANTRRLHKMVEAIDSRADTFDCLMDRKLVWEWVLPRIETELSGRTLQKYLLALEKFYRFVARCNRFPHLPQFSEETRDSAENLLSTSPDWRRSVHKIAAEKRWKRLLADPEYVKQICHQAVKRCALISSATRSVNSAPACSNENNVQEPTSRWPSRKKWDKKDVKLLLAHFKKNPGRAAIRKKMERVSALRRLKNSEGLERCYEKVKSLYRKKK